MRNMTRRDFVRVSGLAMAGGIGVFVGGYVRAAGVYGDLRMGLQSYTLRNFSFDEALERIAKLGLQHVEIFPGHLDHNKASASEVAGAKKRMSDLGIQADGYGVVGFDRNEGAARKVFDFAKALEMRSISADPKPESFDMLDKLVEEYRIPIAIHNHGPHHHWGRPEVILEAVKDHHQLIGLCADTGHFLRAGVDPVAAIKMLKGRVYGLHVKDFVSEHEEVVAGEGKLDVAALVAEVKSQGFDGTCSIEFELDPEDPTAGIKKGLANVRAAVEKIG